MPPPFLTRWRVRLAYPVAVVFFLLARPTPQSIAVGAVIGILGLLIRAAAAGHLRKHEGLAISGPYAYTRNPLYLGSALLAAGLLVGGHSFWSALLVFAFFLAFYPGVMRREETELLGHYGEEYEEYAASVPFFWPAFRKYSHEGGDRAFSFALYRRNREYQAPLGFVGVMLVLWLVMHLRATAGASFLRYIGVQ